MPATRGSHFQRPTRGYPLRIGCGDAGQIAGGALRLADGLIRIYRFDPATESTPAQVTLMGAPNSIAEDMAFVRAIDNREIEACPAP